MKLTETQKEIAKNLYVSFLVTGNNRYGYFGVRADKVDEFQKLVSTNGEFKLPEYATLIVEGEGEPTAEVKQRVEAQYAFSHDFLADLMKQAAA